jgi:hypothetical protein
MASEHESDHEKRIRALEATTFKWTGAGRLLSGLGVIGLVLSGGVLLWAQNTGKGAVAAVNSAKEEAARVRNELRATEAAAEENLSKAADTAIRDALARNWCSPIGGTIVLDGESIASTTSDFASVTAEGSLQKLPMRLIVSFKRRLVRPPVIVPALTSLYSSGDASDQRRFISLRVVSADVDKAVIEVNALATDMIKWHTVGVAWIAIGGAETDSK